jgi:uncharacterized protein (TIGR00369 family)
MSDAPHPSSLITPESVRNFLPGSFPGDLGIEPLEIEDSHSRGRIVVDKRHLHPGGFVHGGVWTALGDTVAAWATFRNIPPRHNFTTIELKLNVFAAGVLGDEIVAVGEPLHAGKSTVVIEVRMERHREGTEPRLAANLIVSQFVLPPEGACPSRSRMQGGRRGSAPPVRDPKVADRGCRYAPGQAPSGERLSRCPPTCSATRRWLR